MGTRGLTNVIYEGEKVISQYGQWDHYPEGVGLQVLNYVRSKQLMENLKTNLNLITEAEELEDNVWMDRDVGPEIIPLVALNVTGEESIRLFNEADFEDSIYCEGVAVVDFDTNTYTFKHDGFEHSYPMDNLPTEEEFVWAFRNDVVRNMIE